MTMVIDHTLYLPEVIPSGAGFCTSFYLQCLWGVGGHIALGSAHTTLTYVVVRNAVHYRVLTHSWSPGSGSELAWVHLVHRTLGSFMIIHMLGQLMI